VRDAPRRRIDDGLKHLVFLSIRNNVRQVVESALTVKGQATIPKAVRTHLRLKAGDRVKFFIHPDGSVVILPKQGPRALRGFIRKPARV